MTFESSLNNTPPSSLLPLDGIRVVALEQAVSAPFCSRQLADMGADVVKLERPDGGDFARGYDSALHGVSTYFAWLNRGKRSVVLDLKNAAGRAALGKLLARADVFVHNLGPGAVERLGFGEEVTRGANSRLIWVSISGYGLDGPYAGRKAYDLLIQQEAAVPSITGSPDAPAKVGISIADISAGLYAYSSILAALLQRSRTGKGERIDISMLECLSEWMLPPLYSHLGTGKTPARAGVRHNLIVPYGAYACRDGEVNLAIQNEREWSRFCGQVLEQPELERDERFRTNELRLLNRTLLEPLIERCFAAATAAETLARLERAEIANGAVNDVPGLAQHPQLLARARWTTVGAEGGEIPALVPPHNLASAPARMGRVPALGEHTDEVLAELEAGA
jgi:itaconate CoA-transferase